MSLILDALNLIRLPIRQYKSDKDVFR